MDWDSLLPFCTTDRQREMVEQCKAHGTPTTAAKHVGDNCSHWRGTIRRIKARAANKGVATECGINRPTMEGFSTQRVSKCIKTEEGLEWHIQTKDQQAQELFLKALIEGLKDDIPKALPVHGPQTASADQLCLYPITDYHLGMYAWAEESGEDWDMAKAQDLWCRWFSTAVKLAPDADVGLLAQLGDFLHWDGLDAVTPANKHVLDADTRFQKVVRCAIRLVRFAIDLLLKKHKKLHVIMASGNHDPASSAWLRELLSAMYENEPRITIETSPDIYYAYKHGKTALFFHHGHKRKMNNISEVFAAKFKDVMFGSNQAYGHLGHLHHVEAKESALITLEQHRTLAPKDAYASSGGWMSGRDAKVITYDKEVGEVSRLTISPNMV